MKNKNNTIIISILSFIIFILILFIIFLIFHKQEEKSIDGSTMTSSELIQMFEKEGYQVELNNIDSRLYIIFKNEKEGITIQKIPNTFVGTLMTYKDDSINTEWADLLDLSSNDTYEKKQQYKAYQSWLEYYNISKSQLSNMLDYYSSNNKDKIEYIDTNVLLHSN